MTKKSNVRNTSIVTYQEIISEGYLAETQEKVFSAIHYNPLICDREIQEITNLSINCVTGRRNELLNLGLIEEAGTTESNITGRKVIVWAVPEKIKIKPINNTIKIKCKYCKGEGYVFQRKLVI